MSKRVLSVLLLLATAAPCGIARGAAKADDPAEAEAEAPVGVLLGDFYLRESRGSEDAKVRLSFSLYAEVSAENADEFTDRVERYRHRVRDQVITATRMAELADFNEPKLLRLRRRVLMRLKRAAPQLKIDRLMFAEFEYMTE